MLAVGALLLRHKGKLALVTLFILGGLNAVGVSIPVDFFTALRSIAGI